MSQQKKFSVEFREGTPDIIDASPWESSDDVFVEDSFAMVVNNKPHKSILKKRSTSLANGHKSLSQQSSLPTTTIRKTYAPRKSPLERCHSEPWERNPYRLPMLSTIKGHLADQTAELNYNSNPSMISGRYLYSYEQQFKKEDMMVHTTAGGMDVHSITPRSQSSASFHNKGIFLNSEQSRIPRTANSSHRTDGLFNCSSEFVETLRSLKYDENF